MMLTNYINSMTELIGMEFELITYQISREKDKESRQGIHPGDPKHAGILLSIQEEIERLEAKKQELEGIMISLSDIKSRMRKLSDMGDNGVVKVVGIGTS